MNRIPDSFRHKGVRAPRWLVMRVVNAEAPGGVVAMLDGHRFSEALATGVGQTLADALGEALVVVKENRARRNPTLVHHGYAQGATFHLLTRAGAPLADLYTGRATAIVVGRTLANALGTQVMVAANTYAGQHGNDAFSHKSPLEDSLDVTSVGTRRNPTSGPRPGEVWTAIRTGHKCRVRVPSRAGMVTYLDLSNGKVYDETVGEFTATHRPPVGRLNPSRSKKARARRVGWRGKGSVPRKAYRAVAAQVRSYASGTLSGGRGLQAKLVSLMQRHHARKARRNPLAFGEQVSPNEARLLRRLWPPSSVLLDSVTRRSAREFDLEVHGSFLRNLPAAYRKKGEKFGAWLPLATVSAADWTLDPIAGMSDYPDMARAGDWSGIRDSDPATVWRMFEYVTRSSRRQPNPKGRKGWKAGDRFALKLPVRVDDLDLPAGATGRLTLYLGGPIPSAFAVFDAHPYHYPVPIAPKWLERPKANPKGRKPYKRQNAGGPRIVYNRLLGGWYVVTGPHQTPLNGRFNTKAEAQAWLAGGSRRNPWAFRATIRKVRSRKAAPAPAPAPAPLELVRAPRAPRAPRARRPRFAPGDEVTTPYVGRSSYFGREVKRTRDLGIVRGYDEQAGKPVVRVDVHQGPKTVKIYWFEERELRRRRTSLRDRRSSWEQHPRLWASVQREVGGDEARALELAELADEQARELYTQMGTAYEGPGHGSSPEYTRLARQRKRLLDRAAMLNRLAQTIQQAQPDYVDPFAVAVGNPRRRANPRRRSNPNTQDERSRAEAMFRKWHEFPSERVKAVKVPSRTIPRHVVGLGKVVRIDYVSNKWEGKPVTYTHSTKRPHPELVTDPDGRQLYLVGGRMKPTADGLVN